MKWQNDKVILFEFQKDQEAVRLGGKETNSMKSRQEMRFIDKMIVWIKQKGRVEKGAGHIIHKAYL